MSGTEQTLAHRLGKTVHVSPLRWKLRRLSDRYPCANAKCLEDWLVAVANARKACIVELPSGPGAGFIAPQHALWIQVLQMFSGEAPPREPILHWTRLAEPITKNGRCDAAGWRLVA